MACNTRMRNHTAPFVPNHGPGIVLQLASACPRDARVVQSELCGRNLNILHCHQFYTSGMSWNSDYSNDCIHCRLCEAVFRNGRTPDRSHWSALSDPWGSDVKLCSGIAERLTGVTEAPCLIREVQMWSCDGCMWWPHTTELAHSHNHTNRNVEAAMSDSDKTFDLFLYLNSWMTFLLLKFDQTQWGKLLEWKL